MPHQCVRCNAIFEDGDNAILKGCDCGAKLFFFIKKERIEDIKKQTSELTQKQKEEIEKDVFDLVGSEVDREQPVILDFESIRILKPGQYELDLVNLFKEDPLIFKLEEGKYMIDLISTFKNLKKRK